MFNIGIDFDNTIVDYDRCFYDLALEKDLIPSDLKKSKNAVRNFLRKNNKDSEFTYLQGEMYGPNILKAKPAKNSLETIKKMNDLGFEIFIISHKTKYPYKGPKFDLHDSARNWLSHYSFVSSDGAKISKDKIFFNTSKDEKINKIHDLNCDFFIDDLPEILDLINPHIKKILFNDIQIVESLSYNFKSTNWKLIGEYIFQFI